MKHSNARCSPRSATKAVSNRRWTLRWKRLPRDLEKQLDPQIASSILGKFRSEMKANVTTLVRNVGNIFDVDQPGSVGHRLKTQLDENNKELSQQTQAIVTQLAAKSAAGTERLKGTRKGVGFKDALEAVLSGRGRARRDRLESVTQAAGLIPGCKSGDFVIEIAPRDAAGQELRIAIEAKNDQTRHPEAVHKLDEAIQNRDAAVGDKRRRRAEGYAAGLLPGRCQDIRPR